VWGGAGLVSQRKVIIGALLDEGTLLPLEVDGIRGQHVILGDELPLLQAAKKGRQGTPQVAFLAPLDPLMWDRPMLRELFGFDYLWEVYTPAAKRRHGYYVLPILFGDRFAGRIEPRYDRKARKLEIVGVWFEDGFRPMEEPHFVPALQDAVRAYQSFVGAEKITWPRTRIGRELAKATR